MTSPLYFAHANGFPSLCYRKLFLSLQDEFELTYINKIGHDTTFPVTDNWEHLCDELLADLAKQHSKPVIGIGHSLGGVLMFLAASRAPHLFRAIILLDSPIYGGWMGHFIRVSKRLHLAERLTPAGRTKNRRIIWPDRETALKHFQAKPMFARFDPDCLQDYITYGLVDCKDGVRLDFNRDIEYHIFKTLPHNLANYRSLTRPPVLLLYGEQSTLFKQHDLRYMREYLHIELHKVAGGHMFPFERPVVTGQILKTLIQQF